MADQLFFAGIGGLVFTAYLISEMVASIERKPSNLRFLAAVYIISFAMLLASYAAAHNYNPIAILISCISLAAVFAEGSNQC